MGLFRPVVTVAWLAFVAVSGAACTKSHDIELATESLVGGSSGNASSAGRAGTSSAGRAGGSAGMGTIPRAGTTAGGNCGACAPGNIFGFISVPACCTGGKCGLDLSTLGLGSGCAEMNAPGALDPSCPAVSVGGFASFDGCCRSDGTCGGFDTFVGLGCAANPMMPTTRCTPK